MKIGITERGDAALDTSWIPWVQDGKPTILISKDPQKLYEILKENDLLENKNYIVHCTITGMAGTVIEPNVPNCNSLQGFTKIALKIGSMRTVLRVDPIVPTEKGTDTAFKVIKSAQARAQSRIRISFLDMYNHVKERFKLADVPIPYESFHAPFDMRITSFKKLLKLFPLDLTRLEVCGEPDFECTGCVSIKSNGNRLQTV